MEQENLKSEVSNFPVFFIAFMFIPVPDHYAKLLRYVTSVSFKIICTLFTGTRR